MTTTYLITMGQQAKEASYQLATLSTRQKDVALHAIADALEERTAYVLQQNAQDVADGRANGLSESMLDRLLLTEARVRHLADGVRRIATLPDPIGMELESRKLPNGIRLSRRRIPIGVLGVIYEARPNVTLDIAALSLKTGNAVILRGGRESRRSNLALVSVIHTALERVALPTAAVQYIADPDRDLVRQLLRLDAYVDMIIPRGGAQLHKLCREQSSIPVITGGMGVCHIFVDESATVEDSLRVIENAKVQRPSVCNALDTLLVHRHIAASFLPQVAAQLTPHGVTFHAGPEAFRILKEHTEAVVSAGPDDFDQEWLSLNLSVRLVDDVEEAITHIRAHSTEHTESILTNNWTNATRFLDAINSAVVMVNASTRLSDGGQFGLGAEVAISTQKLHARGPMGLEALTTYKWLLYGQMHVRE